MPLRCLNLHWGNSSQPCRAIVSANQRGDSEFSRNLRPSSSVNRYHPVMLAAANTTVISAPQILTRLNGSAAQDGHLAQGFWFKMLRG